MTALPISIAIVGAGPAGLAAAEILSAQGQKVTVYERMPSVGRKFLMAGRGGLNITHSEDLNRFLARYGAALPFLEPAIRSFTPDAMRAWCAQLGEDTFVGTSGRVFPSRFKASPLLRAWLRRLDERGVIIKTRHRWMGWDANGHLAFETPDGLRAVAADATILALGGASWPRLGSVGDWVDVLSARSIRVAPLRPANCGFDVAWSDVFRERFAGTPLKRIAFRTASQTVRGEAVITRHGLEGGAIYALSAELRDMIERDASASLSVDLRPDLDEATIAARLRAPRGKQSATSVLRKAVGLPPESIGLLREAIGPALPADPATLAKTIKAAPLRLTATRPLASAISTAGGVDWSELDDRLMLRSHPGTFVAGEMIDWEAPTGGYLLQAAIATGRAAAAGLLSWRSEVRLG